MDAPVPSSPAWKKPSHVMKVRHKDKKRRSISASHTRAAAKGIHISRVVILWYIQCWLLCKLNDQTCYLLNLNCTNLVIYLTNKINLQELFLRQATVA